MSELYKSKLDIDQQLQFADFLSLAETENDELLASDLAFAFMCAEAIALRGGKALVVGGFARDLVIGAVHGESTTSKDIDIEVYGIEFEILEQLLKEFGDVNLVGESFGIAKLTNPETGNVIDFSIPRSDSKIDKGHKGFKVTGNPHMSIEEAAKRRDFTMNTLALDPLTGELHDWYGAMDDIRNKILRATDPVLFIDDPLRVLRAMQFAARFDMSIDPETVVLCRKLDLTELSGERIGEEWVKLMTKSEKPSVGLRAAKELGILEQLHPELEELENTEQETEWHPEGNVWEHTLLCVDAAARIVQKESLDSDEKLVVMFGALCHDLGKTTTTELREKNGRMRITAHGHDAAGVDPTRSFLSTIKMKSDVTEKVIPIVKNHMFRVGSQVPTERQVRKLAIRLLPANIKLWDLVSRSDSNGRGEEFKETTSSFEIYLKATELNVEYQPPEMLVYGRDLLSLGLGLQPGPELGRILRTIYDAQISGEFESAEDGIKYVQENFQKILQQSI